MTTREKMIAYRKRTGKSIADISRITDIGGFLIGQIEDGWVTHPDIAMKLAKAYELTDEDVKELIPENYRPESKKYDPDRYKVPEPENTKFAIVPNVLDEADIYLIENNREKKRHKSWNGVF